MNCGPSTGIESFQTLDFIQINFDVGGDGRPVAVTAGSVGGTDVNPSRDTIEINPAAGWIEPYFVECDPDDAYAPCDLSARIHLEFPT